MANRKRDQAMYFMVTPRERQLIAEKMAQLGTKNTGAYLRKMAVDGYIVKLDLGSVRELVGLLRGATNNLNQIARRANETRSVYAADVEDMQARYAELWEAAPNKRIFGENRKCICTCPACRYCFSGKRLTVKSILFLKLHSENGILSLSVGYSR